MVAGLPAELGVAVGAFVGTNVDNAVVAVAMVATAPPQRSRRIVAGQALGFGLLVVASLSMAALLFEISPRALGLLGLVPLGLGVRGLFQLRHAEGRERVARRAVGSGLMAAMAVTVAAGGDNLAVYIPLFRAAHLTQALVILAVFAAGEVLLSLGIGRLGRHPRLRAPLTAAGTVAAPLLYCAVGVLVLATAGTLGWVF
jgi:cadmium resistance protein CadD (predicted permease)